MIPKHIQEQIDREAEAFAERTAERIYDVKEYWTTNDRINGYINGAESYASKLLSAEELIEKMVVHINKVLSINERSNEFGTWMLPFEIGPSSLTAFEQLITEYNNYKQQKNGTEE